MKCYNCDSVISMAAKCPVCNTKIEKEDYDLKSTKKIVDKITNINEFTRFIGLFYMKSIYLISISILSAAVALYFYFVMNNNFGYMGFGFIAILAFNYYLEMRKTETFYKDFEKGKNHYYILWPFRTMYRSIYMDANEEIPTKKIMRKRNHAYENRDPELRILRFNSYKLFHPQKPKLFNTKEQFIKKHFDEKYNHYLKTNNYDHESYVIAEGTVHGFLFTDKGVITIFNTPDITKQVLNSDALEYSESIDTSKELTEI